MTEGIGRLIYDRNGASRSNRQTMAEHAAWEDEIDAPSREPPVILARPQHLFEA